MNENVRSTVFSTLKFNFAGKITEMAGVKGVYVKYDGRDAVIGFDSKATEARCYFLLAMHVTAGEETFEITEKPAFDVCGPMLDVSRGRVMSVDGVKRFLDIIISLGMNMLMLYTEDMFELEGYPLFGYQRGRYTLSELREIDDYADSLGVEVIPCIQTLAHLQRFLRYRETAHMAENSSTLLPDEESTYEFIEAEIRTVRSAFRSNKIHLGMDEAHKLGLGKYLSKHGLVPEAEIFYSHLNRVLEIARKYYPDTKPMIWSDMLFNSKYGPYSDKYILPQEIVDNAPEDVALVYWDYYRQSEDYYDKLLAQHVRFKNEIMFAGGVWSFDGMVPNFTYTYKTMKPAMEMCLKYDIKTMIITFWASSHVSADFCQSAPGLTVFSEYCYKGAACTDDDIFNASAFAFGVPRDLYDAISDIYLGQRGASSFQLGVTYGDPLLNLIGNSVDYEAAAKTFEHDIEVLDRYPEYENYQFYRDIFAFALEKVKIYARLRPAYLAGDKAYMASVANDAIPRMIPLLEKIHAKFKEDWNKDYKAMGVQTFTMYMGAAIQRLKDVREILQDYVDGKIDHIEELDEEVMNDLVRRWYVPYKYITPFL